MAVEVILKEHVENLGRRGDIVKVSEGYARNFLLPRKLALPVNAGSRRQVEKGNTIAAAREAQEQQQAEALAARIAEIEVVMSRKVGEHDVLYGSVTTADIVHGLQAQHQIEIDRKKVHLAEPLKQLGEFTVAAKIHREVSASIKVRIVAEEPHR